MFLHLLTLLTPILIFFTLLSLFPLPYYTPPSFLILIHPLILFSHFLIACYLLSLVIASYRLSTLSSWPARYPLWSSFQKPLFSVTAEHRVIKGGELSTVAGQNSNNGDDFSENGDGGDGEENGDDGDDFKENGDDDGFHENGDGDEFN